MDFTGFSFDGIHSSTLNLHRVASGDRYKETLHPEIEDRTLGISGLDGELFFGTNFKSRPIEISIAYDSVTEEQFRLIRRLFGTKKICNLIFDERPYKVYQAKIEEPIELEYICFDEEEYTWNTEDHIGYIDGSIDHKVYTGNKRRIYKGEGKIEFICYFPFARQLYKTLDDYMETDQDNSGATFTTYSNVDEWAASSGILTREVREQYNVDRVEDLSDENTNFNKKITVYNPGDINTGFYLYLPFDTGSIEPAIGDYVRIYGDDNGLLLKPILSRKSSRDSGILINTVNHLIEGVIYDFNAVNEFPRGKRPWIKTGTIYNEYIAAGDFPHIRNVDWYLDSEKFKQAIYLNFLTNEVTSNKIRIHYDYLYF